MAFGPLGEIAYPGQDVAGGDPDGAAQPGEVAEHLDPDQRENQHGDRRRDAPREKYDQHGRSLSSRS